MRGTCHVLSAPDRGCGIIPAGAGHLITCRARKRVKRDHPRRCGALGAPITRRQRSTGSSPQVRGTFPCELHHNKTGGIIPAGAGHLVTCRARKRVKRDHPRRCGALGVHHAGLQRGMGSSPQVRGTSPFLEWRIVVVGIIPAGAGHFNHTIKAARTLGDHPRRCGALQYLVRFLNMFLGSSPQVRGTSRQKLPALCPARIIPAGAGHLDIARMEGLTTGDHPRRCGALWFYEYW